MAKKNDYEIKTNYVNDECILGTVTIGVITFKFSGYWVKPKKKSSKPFLSVRFGTYQENKGKWYSDISINDKDLYKSLVDDITKLFEDEQ